MRFTTFEARPIRGQVKKEAYTLASIVNNLAGKRRQRSSGLGNERSQMKTLTQIHVAISLVGILSGIVVVIGLLTAKRFDRWTALFLLSTLATSVTGFFFPFRGLTPAIIVGILSIVLLAGAIVARYARGLVGAWRPVYVVTAIIALYLNVFVLIVQLFQNVPSLKALAPTQTEPAFLVTQLAALLVFVALTIAATIRFRVESVSSLTR
jgi:hypothetical protein